MNGKTPVERMMDEVQWELVDPPCDLVITAGSKAAEEAPRATHSGVLEIGGIKIRCWRLSTGQAVLDPAGLDELFPGWRDIWRKTRSEERGAAGADGVSAVSFDVDSLLPALRTGDAEAFRTLVKELRPALEWTVVP